MRDRLIQRNRPIEKIARPFEEFTRMEGSGGILLVIAAVIALVWANSPFSESYFHLWELEIGLSWGGDALTKSLHHWINDGLMVLFFFVVGLEIKREVLIGELASFRKAAVPITAALGGMLVPASLYWFFNGGTPAVVGWGIPMATDIAFALGILALVGKGVPMGLTIFLAALAIVDDLGAVLVIAIFYTDDVAVNYLLLAGVVLGLLGLLNRFGVRQPFPYLVLGIVLWLFTLKSGVHATVAGVMAAMAIPARAFIDIPEFIQRSQTYLQRLETIGETERPHLYDDDRQAAVHGLEKSCEMVETPLQRFEHALLPWINYLIVPLFALANAGVDLAGDLQEMITEPVTLGIVTGLVVGKPVGIILFSWATVALGLGSLAYGVTWRQMIGTGFLAGIGFTMSLFIANLAFGTGELLNVSKLGILMASSIAGILGWFLVRTGVRTGRPYTESGA